MKFSLAKISFFNIISTVIVFSLVSFIFIYNFSNTLSLEEISIHEERYYDKNKALIKNETERVIQRIEVLEKIINKKGSNEEVREIIFNELKKDRFGDKNFGYFWIIGLDSVVKMNGASPDMVGKYLDSTPQVNGQLIGDLLINKALDSGGYVKYKWIDPSTKKEDQKITYAQLLPDWNMIIGTGFYLSELKKSFAEEKASLAKIRSEYLTKIYVVFGILIVLSLIIGRYLSSKINNIELSDEENINLLGQFTHLLDVNSIITRTNTDGRITYVNDNFETVTGYKSDEIIGKMHSVLRHPDTPISQIKNLWDTISSGEIWKGIIKNKCKNGESYYASYTLIPIKNKQGKILQYISTSTDITEHIENRTKLQNLFKTDTLTGLGNRVSLLNYITKNNNIVLALINIDRFKEINDSFSHEVGDSVIKEFGNRLFDHFNSKSYFIFRIQADVFGIINLRKSKENVKQDIELFMGTKGNGVYEVDENTFRLTYTCGMASQRENLFAYADIALQTAKKKNIEFLEYNSSLKDIKDFKNNIEWVNRLNKAISEDKIVPHFQPIYNYKTGKIDKYESLMRLIEDDTIIYPNSFLDIAKKTKLYPSLTHIMIEKVLDKFSSNDLFFSINLCIEDFMNKELTTFLYEYAIEKKVSKRMVIEIVETEEIEDNEYILEVINTFKEIGTQIAIDDFGTGYSNYDYLIKLQADYIKIDGSIIKLIVSDPKSLDVVISIVEFAKKSNIKVIAEFVSDEHIDKKLREIGVDFAQGYYYGKPQAELI